MLTLQIRTAVFPQIHRIKIPTCDDDTFRHMVLKKIIEVPVYIQYGFTRRLFGMPFDECRRYFSLIIVGEMPCRVFICFHIKKNQYILFCKRGTHPKKWRAKNHTAYVCRNFHPFVSPRITSKPKSLFEFTRAYHLYVRKRAYFIVQSSCSRH